MSATLLDLVTVVEGYPAIVALMLDESLSFNGLQDGFGYLPDQWLFTDYQPGSPSYGATICVEAGCDARSLSVALLAVREKFAAASSWGDPQGGDSGFDYARNN